MCLICVKYRIIILIIIIKRLGEILLSYKFLISHNFASICIMFTCADVEC